MPFTIESYLEAAFDAASFKESLKAAKQKLKGIKFDSIAVSGVSGIAYGAKMAHAMKKNLIVVRKIGEKSHSYHNPEGNCDGQRVLIVDDFVSSGKTVERIRRRLKSSKSKFNHMEIVGVYEYYHDRFHNIKDRSADWTDSQLG